MSPSTWLEPAVHSLTKELGPLNFHFCLCRKSLAEHEAERESLDKERQELEEAMAKSEAEHQRLTAQKDSQQALLAEHFKSKVSISDPSVGK